MWLKLKDKFIIQNFTNIAYHNYINYIIEKQILFLPIPPTNRRNMHLAKKNEDGTFGAVLNENQTVNIIMWYLQFKIKTKPNEILLVWLRFLRYSFDFKTKLN